MRQRFQGRVEKAGGFPWGWYVYDRKKMRRVAWGEEFSFEVALRLCGEATMGARWWHLYGR